MPHTSEKARITHQLHDIWLSNTIIQALFDTNDNLSIFFKCFKPLTYDQQQLKPDTSGDHDLSLFSSLLDNPITTDFNSDNLLEMRLGEEESVLGQDVMEVIELLGMGIPMIRYLRE
ncbi:hypothetical protein HOY82DRAFT_535859 [Tuber indicum]|nr:hypothetical protein HOY82DRAFT_535859 [Tuber indicum]